MLEKTLIQELGHFGVFLVEKGIFKCHLCASTLCHPWRSCSPSWIARSACASTWSCLDLNDITHFLRNTSNVYSPPRVMRKTMQEQTAGLKCEPSGLALWQGEALRGWSWNFEGCSRFCLKLSCGQMMHKNTGFTLCEWVWKVGGGSNYCSFAPAKQAAQRKNMPRSTRSQGNSGNLRHAQVETMTLHQWFVWFKDHLETGRTRFKRVWFQTPSSVSLLPLPSSREGAQWVPLSRLFACKSELTEFSAELTTRWVLSSETVLSQQYSARFLIIWYIYILYLNG